MFFRVATLCNISFVERGYSFLQMCSKAEPFKTETRLEIEREMFKLPNILVFLCSLLVRHKNIFKHHVTLGYIPSYNFMTILTS